MKNKLAKIKYLPNNYEIIEPGDIKKEEKPIEKIRDKIKSKTGLKEAFILKEILDRKYD